MRVVVIGGTRFIGRAVCDELVTAGHDLLVVHRGHTEPAGLPDATHLHISRLKLHGARRELQAFEPDAVVDGYAMTREDAVSALAALPSGLRIVVLSSCDVYRAYSGLHHGTLTDALPLDELSPTRRERYPYKETRPDVKTDVDFDRYEKLDVEEVYRQAGATICRLGFVYGEHDFQRREEFILRRVRAGRDRIPVGPGTWLGSRVYVRDVAVAVRLALESERAAGEVFNITEERTWPAGIWAQRIVEAAGSRAELVRVPESVLPQDLADWTAGSQQHLLATSAKARELLLWHQSDPTEAVYRSVNWHLEHPPEREDPDFSADDRALEYAS
jgi:nucleoside-diphosphate-sugar epimerase